MMRVRYAIYHKHPDGFFKLTRPNQARHHFDTREEAEQFLAAVAPSLREKTLGDAADTLMVAPVECFGHGDAIGIFLRNPK